MHTDIACHLDDRPTVVDHETNRLRLVLLRERAACRTHPETSYLPGQAEPQCPPKRERSNTSSGAVTAAWLYCYDADGNRTSTSTSTATGATCTSSPTTSYGYNNADELTSLNGSSSGWSYDADGNETTGLGATTRTAEAYSGNNQLTSITSGGSAVLFNYLGLSNGERSSTSDSTGTTNYQSSPLGLASQSKTSGSVYYTRDPDGTLISLRTGAGSVGVSHYYYEFDGLGSVVSLTDASGTVVNTYGYDPYGNLRGAPTEAVSNPYRYTGGYQDAQTGLYKLGVRYYDSTLGRFTQPDPSGQAANTYLYAGSDPANYTDPTGQDAVYTAYLMRDQAIELGGAILAGGNLGTVLGSLFGPIGTLLGELDGGIAAQIGSGILACGVNAGDWCLLVFVFYTFNIFGHYIPYAPWFFYAVNDQAATFNLFP